MLQVVVVVLMALALLGGRAAPAMAQQIEPCDARAPVFAPSTREPSFEVGPTQTTELVSEHDGVAIALAVVRPVVPEGTRVPVVLQASPYFDTFESIDEQRCAAALVQRLVPQGYAVALLAVRGSGSSGGCMELAGPGERADIDQAITWLGTRPWSTGAVGMHGKSYDGLTQWAAAASGNPHLRTIVPAAGVPDVFRLLFGGGTPDWRGAAVLGALYYGESVALYNEGRRPERTAQVTACPEYAVASAANAWSHATGEVDPFGFWAARRYVPEVLARFGGSVLLLQGLQDWNVSGGQQFPLADDLRERGVRVAQVWGQWGHAQPDQATGPARRPDWGDALLAWYDRELKGEPAAPALAGAEVQDSEGRWRREPTWPPPGRARRLALQADGALAEDPGGSRAGTRVLAADPAHTQPGAQQLDPPDAVDAGCPAEGTGCAAFRTSVMGGGLRFAGRPLLRLRLTPGGPAGHVSAYLYGVAPSGAARRLGWGQADLRFPDRDGPSRPVVTGRPVDLRLHLEPLDAVVPAGGRLLLVLSQGTAQNRVASMPPAPVELAVGGGGVSSLELTEVEPQPDAFFEP